jgi:glucose-1-phosphate adenylyltransferase
MLCNIVACILAGGEGTRLLPLTVRCAKPAVRFGGSYRLIDLTLSNCVNSDIRQMLVLPQYQAQSLEDHLRQDWSFLSQERGAYVMSMRRQWGQGGIWVQRMRCTNTSPSWSASTRRMS